MFMLLTAEKLITEVIVTRGWGVGGQKGKVARKKMVISGSTFRNIRK